MSGYCDCACRDCFEIAIGEAGQALCWQCEQAGCEAGAEQECQVEPDLEDVDGDPETISLRDAPTAEPDGTIEGV